MIDRDFEVSMEVVPAKDGATEDCTWVNPPYCRKCGGACYPSKALVNLVCGTPDSNGSLVGATLGMSKDVEMVGCLKCGICGHSFVLGKDLK